MATAKGTTEFNFDLTPPPCADCKTGFGSHVVIVRMRNPDLMKFDAGETKLVCRDCYYGRTKEEAKVGKG